MRFSAKLVAVLLCLAIGACAALGAPGAGGSSTRRSGIGDGDGGGLTPIGDDSPGCEMACAPFECGEGTHPAPLPGECCPETCEPDDCSLVDCPPITCPAGQRLARSKDTCCSVCVRGVAATAVESCARGQAGYESFFDQLKTELGANLCEVDANCHMVVIDNRCSHGCGMAVNARVASTLKEDLDDYAATHCAACPESGSPCAPVEHIAFCAGGVCAMH